MNTLLRRISAALLFAIIGVLVFAATSAFAQTPTPAAPAAAAAGGPPTLDPLQVILLVALTMLGIFGLWLIVFRYTFNIQSMYYQVLQKLAQGGTSVTASSVTARAFMGGRTGVLGAGDEPAPPTILQIEGPRAVNVGAKTTYKATTGQEGDMKPAQDAVWEITPTNIAVIDKTTGAEVSVTPAVTGTFTLTVKLGSGSTALAVEAVAPQAKSVELPFFGEGYGSIGIAIIVLGLVLILGLTQVLSGEAIATILGALVGYIFGVGTTSAQNKTGGQGGAGGGQSGGAAGGQGGAAGGQGQ